MVSRPTLAALAVAAALLAPGPARANGRFPATIDVRFKPGDDQVMGLQVTWGFLVTDDGGQTWHWICEDAIGFGGVYDPDLVFTATGTLFGTTTSSRGLAYTHDQCEWQGAPAPLGGMDPATFVSQIAAGPDGTLYAVASTFTDNQLYASPDDGATFHVVSNPGGKVDWWESLEAAPTTLPSGETRLYLTGYLFEAVPGGGPMLKKRRMFRSDDSGATWTELSTAAFHFTKATLPDLQIAAVSPADPDLVFARVRRVNGVGIGDDIWRSPDAGVTWTKVFASGDDVTAVVVRRSGQVVLGERLTGVHLSSDGGQTFGAPLPDSPEVDCMRERDDGVLFLCGKSFGAAHMALGRSDDAITWTSLLTYDQVDDALPGCPAGTTQHDVCYATRWCIIACQFGIDDPACQPCSIFAPDATPAPDAGGEEPPPKSCCSAGSPQGAAALSAMVALALIRRRRRA